MFCLGEVHTMVSIQTVKTESYMMYLQFFSKGECYVRIFHVFL